MGLHLLLSRQLSMAQAIGHGLVSCMLLPPLCYQSYSDGIAGCTRRIDCANGARRLLPVGQAALAGNAARTCRPARSLLNRAMVLQELEVLRFNVLDNKSSEWGTSAFHWHVSF